MGLIRQYNDDQWRNFALVMGENGDWNKAEQLEVQVMDMRKKLLGAKLLSSETGWRMSGPKLGEALASTYGLP